MPTAPPDPLAVAVAYATEVERTGVRAAALIEALWRRVHHRDVMGTWRPLIPDMVAVMTAAQTVAASMADPYVAAVLAAQGSAPPPAGEVDPSAFAGQGAEGIPLDTLALIPAQRAEAAMRAGVNGPTAMLGAQSQLVRIARTEVADAARAAASVAGVSRRCGGYVRALRPPTCARCAILAGRYYRYSRGFKRHPHCDCVNLPVENDVPEGMLTDFKTAFDGGHVHGLTKAETQAIKLGADPSQVVNARDGMRVAGDGRRYTTTGTTRRGIAGARLIAAAINRAEGGPTGQTFRNMTMDRLTLLEKQAQYGNLLRKGNTFTRTTRDGGLQSYSYRFSASPRASVADLLATSTSPEDAVRVLINHGYII